ncbi:hypothetical protein HIM_00656 [Hirsutella minnesotensis 3608]|nr:hypothetical protein HIM_00656 [Hirsutella minnesotensis 3608]
MASVKHEAPSSSAQQTMRRLTEQEVYRVQQYEKIVRLHDAIVSGSHPTIKIPGLKSRQAQVSLDDARAAAQSTSSDGASQDASHQQPQSVGHETKQDDAPRGPLGNLSAGVEPLGSGQKEINPVLLEKSDELVRAEIMMQRRRLERILQDEVEQRRQRKGLRQSGPPAPAVNISDVFAKALTLAPPVAAPKPAAPELSANPDNASDSFDDNTFYSSQHETPLSQMASRVRHDSADPKTSDAASQSAPQPEDDRADKPDVPAIAPEREQPAQSRPPKAQTEQDAPLVNCPSNPPRPTIVPGLTFLGTSQRVEADAGDNCTNAGQKTQESSGRTPALPSRAETSTTFDKLPRNSYGDNRPPSPLVRSHALEPVAPQPAQTSALAVGAQAQGAPAPVVPRTRATPAQVAALRHEATATSPESSSQGGRASDKRKNKKKKRKADRQAPEIEDLSYIKLEPRSPSPLTAPSYVRPKKRQRQSQGRVIDVEYEPTREPPAARALEDYSLSRYFRDNHLSLGLGDSRAYPQRALSSAMAGDQRYGREYLEERRLPPEGQARGYGQLSSVPPWPYSPRATYPPRPVPQAFAGDGYREPARHFRDMAEVSRLSVRPEDAYAGQPRPAPHRVLVDAYGREYYDPLHPAVHRAPAPSVGPGEPGVVYERMASRAISRHPGGDLYGDGGMVYGATPGGYATPRRVVTQPTEYTPYDYRDGYRDGQHRDFPPRAMAPPNELVEVGLDPDRRGFAEPPRGYPTRAASLMPMEGVRYDAPPVYGRMPSVRPELPVPEYAPMTHPEERREALQPYMNMREYSARHVEPYQRPHAREGDEVAFVERPRGAAQDIVYTDDARRDVYQ